MKHLLYCLLFAVTLATSAHGQTKGPFDKMTIQELQDQAPDLHPAALYVLSARLLSRGEGQAAANWMYAGQLRYRFLLKVRGGDAGNDAVLFSALSKQVGRPVNEYIAGDVDEWLAAMDWALEWDAANRNGAMSKTEHAAALADVRAGLAKFRASVEERRDIIPKERLANGLTNR